MKLLNISIFFIVQTRTLLRNNMNHSEKVVMLLIYWECQKNARCAAQNNLGMLSNFLYFYQDKFLS